MHPLDNPIWTALTTLQTRFANVNKSARRFQPEVTTLAGIESCDDHGFESLAGLVPAGKPVPLLMRLGASPPQGWGMIFEVPLLQMVADGDAPLAPSSKRIASVKITEMGEADVPEMIALTKLTEPGPFGSRTRELGAYLGIRREAKLAAMAGERLRVPGFTEISAVCTHPDHVGHGYASALMAVLMKNMRERGEIPFLHVRAENTRAVDVYKRLGFKERVTFQLMVLRSPGMAS